MVIKLVGAGIIIGVAGWTGLQKARQLSLRSEGLRQLRMDIDFLEKEIDYARTPLVQALDRTARVSAAPVDLLFRESHQALAGNRTLTAREAWSRGIAALRKNGVLSEDDIAIISLVGERMGTSDAQDQVKVLRLVAAELKAQEEKSRQKEDSERKIWSYGGFLVGLMITILMM